MSAAELSGVGIIYCVDGPVRFFREAIVSACSVLFHHPEISIAIASASAHFHAPIFETHLQLEPNSPFSNKVHGVSRSPFENTLFLDTDTLAIRSLDRLLEPSEADIRICRDWKIERKPDGSMESYEVSQNYNTGVFVASASSEYFLGEWRRHVGRRVRSKIDRGGGDQPSFNAVAKRAAKPGTIEDLDPYRYNLRYDIYEGLDATKRSEACLLHDHGLWDRLAGSGAGALPATVLQRALKVSYVHARRMFSSELLKPRLNATLENIEKAPDVPAYYRQLNEFRNRLDEETWAGAVARIAPGIQAVCEDGRENPGLAKVAAEYAFDAGDLDMAQELIRRALAEKPQDLSFWRTWSKIWEARHGEVPSLNSYLELAEDVRAPEPVVSRLQATFS